MLGRGNRVIGGVQEQGLQIHEAVIFHPGEFNAQAISFGMGDFSANLIDQACTLTGFVQFDTTILADRQMSPSFEKHSPQAEIFGVEMLTRGIRGNKFHTPLKRDAGKTSFIMMENLRSGQCHTVNR